MNPTLLAIAIPVAVFIGGCAVILRRKIRDDDVPLFREHTGRHTAEAVAVDSLRALRPGSPYPAGPPAAVIEPAAIMPAPVPDPGPEAVIIAAGTVDADGWLTSASIAPVAESTRPSYVTDEIGDRSVDAWLESAYTRALALELREQLADEAAS